MIKSLLRIPLYPPFRAFNFPRPLPFNITASLTYRCNSRCQTCNVYQRKAAELSVDEWRRIFQSLGRSVTWFTFSGGEPFLFPDMSEVINYAYDYCRPRIINIPTNGILHDIIPEKVKRIATHASTSQIVVNISIDDVGELHDRIRNVPHNYEFALLTLEGLKKLSSANVSIGIHTVISKFNHYRMAQILETIQQLQPDSYITEIAEERVELKTMGADITPTPEEYAQAISFLIQKIKTEKYNGITRITQAFRAEYYKLVQAILKQQRQVIPCYAGFASAHVAPDGDVWMCCIKAESIGNLRECDYDFKRVWHSPKAQEIRKTIKDKQCYCPLANASYTNMLFHPKTLMKVGLNYVHMY